MAKLAENKRIAKNTIYLYLRMIVLLVVGLYSSRVTLMALGISDYGIFNVVGGIVIMFVFINYAMVNSTQRYITYELGKGNVQKLSLIFSTSINIHIIVSIIIVILSETIGLWFFYNKMVIPDERMNAAFWIFQFSIISCVVTVISAPYNALIIAYEKMSAYALISLLDAFLKLGIVLYLLHYGGDRLILYGALVLIIALINFIIYKLFCNKSFHESRYKFKIDKPLMKEMTGFAGWNLIGNFSYICYTQGLNLLLNVFFDPVVNAARGLAVQIQNIVSNFSFNVENAIKPQITKSYANNDMTRMQTLMSVSARLSFYVLWLIALPLLLETEIILDIWLAEVPEHTTNFVRLTLLILLADSLTGPLSTAAQSTGNIKMFQVIVSLLYLLILPLSYISLLITPVPEIVFFINFFVFFITQGVKLVIVGRLIDLAKKSFIRSVFFRAYSVAFFSSTLPVIIWRSMDPSINRLFIIGAVCILFVPIVIYAIGITREERYLVNSKVKVILLKIFHQ